MTRNQNPGEPWENDFTSPHLDFSICIMGSMIPTSQLAGGLKRLPGRSTTPQGAAAQKRVALNISTLCASVSTTCRGMSLKIILFTPFKMPSYRGKGGRLFSSSASWSCSPWPPSFTPFHSSSSSLKSPSSSPLPSSFFLSLLSSKSPSFYGYVSTNHKKTLN